MYGEKTYMPTHQIHRLLAKLLTGQHNPKMDKEIDKKEALQILGKNHRVYAHDPVSILDLSRQLALQKTLKTANTDFNQEFNRNLNTGLSHLIADKIIKNKNMETWKILLTLLTSES